jgi:hypothetical protein
MALTQYAITGLAAVAVDAQLSQAIHNGATGIFIITSQACDSMGFGFRRGHEWNGQETHAGHFPPTFPNFPQPETTLETRESVHAHQSA